MFQITDGAFSKKSVKQLVKFRSEFEAAGVLTSEEMINFVLVVPCGRIHFRKEYTLRTDLKILPVNGT